MSNTIQDIGRRPLRRIHCYDFFVAQEQQCDRENL